MHNENVWRGFRTRVFPLAKQQLNQLSYPCLRTYRNYITPDVCNWDWFGLKFEHVNSDKFEKMSYRTYLHYKATLRYLIACKHFIKDRIVYTYMCIFNSLVMWFTHLHTCKNFTHCMELAYMLFLAIIHECKCWRCDASIYLWCTWWPFHNIICITKSTYIYKWKTENIKTMSFILFISQTH